MRCQFPWLCLCIQSKNYTKRKQTQINFKEVKVREEEKKKEKREGRKENEEKGLVLICTVGFGIENKLPNNGPQNLLKPQVYGIVVASNQQVRIEIYRELDSTTKTELAIQSRPNNSGWKKLKVSSFNLLKSNELGKSI